MQQIDSVDHASVPAVGLVTVSDLKSTCSLFTSADIALEKREDVSSVLSRVVLAVWMTFCMRASTAIQHFEEAHGFL